MPSLDRSVIQPLPVFSAMSEAELRDVCAHATDAPESEFKYVPVRRLALFVERSLEEGTGWAVFEPNDEPLWGELRTVVGAFLLGLFRQGAFAGGTPAQAASPPPSAGTGRSRAGAGHPSGSMGCVWPRSGSVLETNVAAASATSPPRAAR